MPDRRTILAAALALLAAGPAPAQRPPLTVFAAASLADALTEAGRGYTRATGQAVRFSFAASGVAARQIEAGAKADLFVSADEAWMDRLQPRIAARRDLLGGRLALVAPLGSRAAPAIRPGFPLAAALGPRGRLAVGDPASAPAGRYAEEALTRLGVWNSVARRLAPAQDVRGALAFVARGEAPLGIVYESDAAAEPRVRVVGLFPTASHRPIVYPVAVLKRAGPGAAAFYRYLGSGEARAMFRRHRFLPLG